jgi:hypothetical protein
MLTLRLKMIYSQSSNVSQNILIDYKKLECLHKTENEILNDKQNIVDYNYVN